MKEATATIEAIIIIIEVVDQRNLKPGAMRKVETLATPGYRNNFVITVNAEQLCRAIFDYLWLELDDDDITFFPSPSFDKNITLTHCENGYYPKVQATIIKKDSKGV